MTAPPCHALSAVSSRLRPSPGTYLPCPTLPYPTLPFPALPRPLPVISQEMNARAAYRSSPGKSHALDDPEKEISADGAFFRKWQSWDRASGMAERIAGLREWPSRCLPGGLGEWADVAAAAAAGMSPQTNGGAMC